MGIPRTATAIGDVCLDVTSRVRSATNLEDLDQGVSSADVSVRVGGTGVNFVRAARRLFPRVRLIGAVGRDPAGALAEEEMRRADVECSLLRHPTLATGVTSALYFGTHGVDAASRVVMVNEPNANQAIDEDLVSLHSDWLVATAVLMTDGYTAARPDGVGTLTAAIQRASNAGALTAFDLVPHNSGGHGLNVESLSPLLAAVDVVICEARSVLTLVGEPFVHEATEEHAIRALTVLGEIAPGAAYSVRYGYGNADQAILVAGDEVIRYATGFRSAARLDGFGDMLSACELDQLRKGGWARHGLLRRPIDIVGASQSLLATARGAVAP